MKTFAILTLTALTAGPAFVADVSGTWSLTMQWPGDRQSTGVCTFEQDGRKLSGKCGGDDRFAITGQVEDKRLTWEFDVEQNGNRGHMVFPASSMMPATRSRARAASSVPRTEPSR
jgi:hypothetical protein